VFNPPPPDNDDKLTTVTMDSALHSTDKEQSYLSGSSQGQGLSLTAFKAMKYLTSLPEEQQKQVTHMMWQATLESTINALASAEEP